MTDKMPVDSFLQIFRDEVEAHEETKRRRDEVCEQLLALKEKHENLEARCADLEKGLAGEVVIQTQEDQFSAATIFRIIVPSKTQRAGRQNLRTIVLRALEELM